MWTGTPRITRPRGVRVNPSGGLRWAADGYGSVVPERQETTGDGRPSATLADPTSTEPVATTTTTTTTRRQRTYTVRVPPLSPEAPFLGWLTAWGAAALAAACLHEAGVSLGLGLGIATGDPGVEDGFLPGLWLLVVQAGACLLGGYAAGRIARANAPLHAALAWCVAMLATGADAIVIALRDGGESVVQSLGLPHWVHTGLSGTWEEALALAVFALGSLAGALIGGSLAAAANPPVPARRGAGGRTRGLPGVDAPARAPPRGAPANGKRHLRRPA